LYVRAEATLYRYELSKSMEETSLASQARSACPNGHATIPRFERPGRIVNGGKKKEEREWEKKPTTNGLWAGWTTHGVVDVRTAV
jgi:hypothetical protein